MQLDYSYQAPTHNPQSSPIPLDQYRNRPDRQEPGPVPSQEQAEQLIQELFGRKLAAGAFMTYHKDLHKALNHSLQATLGKKRAPVEMAILLYAIIHWHLPGKDGASKLRVQKDGYYWIARKQSEWADDLAVTSRSIQNYLDDLVSLNLIEYRSGAFSAEKTTLVRLLRPGLAEMIENYVSQTGKLFALYQPDTNGKLFAMGDDTKRKVFVIDPPKSEKFSQSNTQISNTQTSNTHKHRAGGGEVDFDFSEGEPRGVVQDGSLKAKTPAPEPEPDRNRNRKQLESLVAQPDQVMADLSPQKHPAGDKASAADFSAAKEFLERAEIELGEKVGPKAAAELLQKSPQALQVALEEAKRRRDNGEIKTSATGAFIELARRDYQPPEEEQIKVVGKAIGRLLNALKLTGFLPPKWREETNCLTISELSLDQQREYLAYLQDLEKQRQREQAQAQADNEEESLGYILFGTQAAQASRTPVATQRVEV